MALSTTLRSRSSSQTSRGTRLMASSISINAKQEKVLHVSNAVLVPHRHFWFHSAWQHAPSNNTATFFLSLSSLVTLFFSRSSFGFAVLLFREYALGRSSLLSAIGSLEFLFRSCLTACCSMEIILLLYHVLVKNGRLALALSIVARLWIFCLVQLRIWKTPVRY